MTVPDSIVVANLTLLTRTANIVLEGILCLDFRKPDHLDQEVLLVANSTVDAQLKFTRLALKGCL